MCITRFLPLILLFSCSGSYLNVHTDYVTREQLASFYVETPDPSLDAPDLGQKLVIKWGLDPSLMLFDDLHLKIQVRYYNKDSSTWTLPVTCRRGQHVYTLLNDEYFCLRGIQTWMVELWAGGEPIICRSHQLFAEKLTLGTLSQTGESS